MLRLCVLLFAVLLACPCAAQMRWWKQWSYNCSKSVFDWPGDYAGCTDSGGKMNHQQSPISIVTQPSDLTNFRPVLNSQEMEAHMHFGSFVGTGGVLVELAVSKAETVPHQVKFKWEESEPMNCLDCGMTEVTKTKSFTLDRISFHHPSEHTIDGKRFPVEVQMFLKEERNDKMAPSTLGVAVLGVLSHKDLVTPVVQELELAIKNQFSDTEVLIDNFNPSSLLPNEGGFFVYNGSDTAPPCSKVSWAIMQHTVNFTSNMVDGIVKHVARFHSTSFGNARPTALQESLQISHHPTTSPLLKTSNVQMTSTQWNLFTEKKLKNFDILSIDPSFLFDLPYALKPQSQCSVKLDEDVDNFPFPPNTHPDILRLRPDTTTETQSSTSAVPPPPEENRKRKGQQQDVEWVSKPRRKFATWTASVAEQAVDSKYTALCDEWKARGSNTSEPLGKLCSTRLARLPHDSHIFASVPMPPLPPKPEPKFFPSNWPVAPSKLNTGANPDMVNPYVPDVSVPYDANNPISGNGPYMHKPNGQGTLILKPIFRVPPVNMPPEALVPGA